MTVILGLAMFSMFLAVEKLTHKPASEHGLQTAAHSEAEVPERRLREFRAGDERRRAERRGRGTQSAA